LNQKKTEKTKATHLKHQGHIKLTDLFHIIDLCGKLLNKREPDEDDETPCEEFYKYARSHEEQGSSLDSCTGDYVLSEDVPKILLAVFAGQPDDKRIDAAALVNKLGSDK